MHTIRLWDPSPPEGPDGWHRVMTPGGYEGWWFDAHDPRAGLRITVAIFLGDIFSEAYLAAYRRFRRRPTRHAPPRPLDHCAVYLSVIENGQSIWQQALRPPLGIFAAIEPERSLGFKDVVSWHVAEDRIRLGVGPKENAAIDLVFNVARASRPCVFPKSTVETPVSQEGNVHRWLVTNPQYQVSGTIRPSKSEGPPPRSLEFHGWGIHAHCVGTAPPADGAGRSVIGSAIFDDRAVLFQFAVDDEELIGPIRVIDLNADVAGENSLSDGEARLCARGSRIQLGDRLVLRKQSPPQGDFVGMLVQHAECGAEQGLAVAMNGPGPITNILPGGSLLARSFRRLTSR